MSPPHHPREISRQAARRLAGELQRRIAGEVRFDAGYRALYATDGSNYRQVPIGVITPHTVEDVIAAMALCHRHQAPVLPRGGGTSLAGQCCNTAVVIDMSKHLNRILDIDTAGRRARVEPGCVLDHLRNAAEVHHLTFGPDPATHDHNTLGGMIGNNSCGVHSVMAGRTADNVDALDVLTYRGRRLAVGATGEDELQAIIAGGGWRGELYGRLKSLRDRYAPLIRERYPRIPRRVSGYNLDELLPERGFNVARALVGSEGTCVTVLGAWLNLVPSPPVRHLMVLGYDDVAAAGDQVPLVLEHRPVGLEGIDDRLIRYMREKGLHERDATLLPRGNGWLFVEIGADTTEEAEERAEALRAALQRDGAVRDICVYPQPGQQERLWAIREAGLAATAHVPDMPDTWPGWEDSAVPPDHVGQYLRDLRALLDRYDYACALYGHFGDGCIHVRIDFDLTSQDGISKYRRFIDEALDLVLQHGGSFSGEHGDGQSRGELLPKMYGPELMEAFREFKEIWDPDWRMNPGKVIDPYRITENLRLGADWRPPALDTTFSFPEDDGHFDHAALRCVGVGKCRHHGGGVMCPSYMATGEEMHSTRGRARLLFEMVHGGPVSEGWRSPAVREALDLCLACKGCKKDCPVNVDMATYKAEFFSHYYAGRLRPRSAYSMGLIATWAGLASRVPGLANAAFRAPGLGRFLKRAGGIAIERDMPAFATETFRQWFARHPAPGSGRPVLLWPDTFTNHFLPQVGKAAVEVLEAAGYAVTLPDRPLCCGRPLYAWGMLQRARRGLLAILDSLADPIGRGVPVIGLEPACLATFRDELPNLLPDDDRAGRLARQSFMLGEFLAHDENYAPPSLQRSALVHAHCNHHAIIGLDGETEILKRLDLDYRVLDSGCCGMAGSFGFEAEHYDVSLRIGERVLLPAVRAADQDTLIITDGFSCREQIAQGTGRSALHLAEVLQQALHEQRRSDRRDAR